jgi:hypothetical protein
MGKAKQLKRLSRRSNVRLFYLLIVTAVVVPAAIFAIAAYYNRLEVMREGRESVVRTTAIMHEHARKVFDSVDLLLDRIDDRIGGNNREQVASPQTSAFLARLKSRFDQVASIWIVDEAGNVLAGSSSWKPGDTIAGRDFFEVHRTKDIDTYISSAFVGRATNVASFAVSRRRPSPDGSFLGTVHVSLKPDYFENFFREASPEHRHVGALIRSDGRYLAREPHFDINYVLGPDTPFMRAIANSDAGVFVTHSALDRRERYYAFQQVAPYPVYVTYGLDQDVVLERWYRHLAMYGAMLAVASLILLYVSWLAMRHARNEQFVLAQL